MVDQPQEHRCPACGEPLSAPDRVCSRCGPPDQPQVVPPIAPSGRPAPPYPIYQPPPGGGTGPPRAVRLGIAVRGLLGNRSAQQLIAALAILALGGVALVLVYLRPHGEAGATAVPTPSGAASIGTPVRSLLQPFSVNGEQQDTSATGTAEAQVLQTNLAPTPAAESTVAAAYGPSPVAFAGIDELFPGPVAANSQFQLLASLPEPPGQTLTRSTAYSATYHNQVFYCWSNVNIGGLTGAICSWADSNTLGCVLVLSQSDAAGAAPIASAFQRAAEVR